MTEMSVRQWQERFRAGDFSSKDRAVQCEAGWYDWFCQDDALAGRLQKLSKVVMGITDPYSPKLVYICAPLRGEVEKNIEFARQKAQEVLQAGDIPVCPHLMFPPIADPGDPAQDLAAREMGLHLVERCQQVNVYGPVFTEGMWAEIHRANKLDIPVVTDSGPKGRTAPRRKKSAKREEVK